MLYHIKNLTPKEPIENDIPSTEENYDDDFSDRPAWGKRHNNTFIVSCLMMYLTGIEKRHFENHIPDLMTQFEEYDKDLRARIIRNLCMVRTSLVRGYSRVNNAFRYELKNIATFPECIPSEAVMQLAQDGINLQKSKPDVINYIIAINQEISNRINNVKRLFPDWLNWDYIRPLFIMPNGLKSEGVRAAKDFYFTDRNRYPYQCYINWDGETNGNLFNSDAKFVITLYEHNEDYFENRSLVMDVGDLQMKNLYDFIGEHQKTLIVVDCENSDPIKLAAALSSFTPSQREAIHKVMLFDSEHTTSMWETLCKTGITEEFDTQHIVVKRLVEHKSQVDMTLAANTCREVYANHVDSVILISSDSDYWALIQSLSDIQFLVMLEREKTGQAILTALQSQCYQYCYLDDFCTAAAYQIKIKTITAEVQMRMDAMVNFNINDLLDAVLRDTWVELTDKEKKLFYDRYLKTMRLKIDVDGNVSVVIE